MWESGLKTLSGKQTAAVSPRWSHENNKVLPQARKETKEIVHTGEWTSGIKTLGAGQSPVKPASTSSKAGDWHAGLKALPKEASPLKPHSSWATEGGKTLGAESRCRSVSPRRILDPDWQSHHKTIEEKRKSSARNYVLNHEKPPTPSVATAASWTNENGKVLSDQSSSRRVVTTSDWSREGKTVKNAPKVLVRHDWASEGKLLPKEEQSTRAISPRTVIREGTGWDSGLYKTINRPKRSPSQPTEWSNVKTIPNKTTDRYQVYNERSWVKTVDSKPTRSTSPVSDSRFHWDMESRKTLPAETLYTAGTGREFHRHVDMKRRQDMQKFHDNLCKREQKVWR